MNRLLRSFKSVRLFILGLLCVTVLFAQENKAQACGLCSSLITPISQYEYNEWFSFSDGTYPIISQRVTTEFNLLRSWIINILWEDNILPAMMLMAEQLSAVAMQQVQIIGTFLDAKQQMETQQLFQKLAAKAHKDYEPSVGMCEFGSTTKSLAASDRRAEYNAVLMSQRSEDRSLGSAYSAASTGEDSDKTNRIKQFRNTYCDKHDNNNGLSYMCDSDQDGNTATGTIGATNMQRANKDIDFARTVDFPWTLKIDFTDATSEEDEQDVMALASNLYGHYVFKRPDPKSLLFDNDPASPTYDPDMNAMHDLYMKVRSLIAKQSVAENSFNAITAMKSAGEPGSRDYMKSILEELGISTSTTMTASGKTEIEELLGDNPSYYAQMEVLTKKIYQNPDFYTNLYDKPANVQRKAVALQAIGLMQKFDLFKSYLRNEASLSVLLELAVTDLQDEIEENIGNAEPGGNRGTP